MPKLAETFSVLEKEWVVGPQRRTFTRDFDGMLYLWEKTDVTYEDITRHVERYVVEKLMKPTIQEMWVGFDGSLDPEYEKRMQNAIDYWTERGDAVAVYQFGMELTGMRNMALLVATYKAQTDTFPSVVVASHPGDFYVDEEKRRKIVTNIGTSGIEVNNGYYYSYTTIPSDFIELSTYYDQVADAGYIQLTEALLQQRMGELNAATFVAFPFLIERYQELAQKLGYRSWDEIEKLSQEYLEDSKDSNASERRTTMIREFSDRYWDAIALHDEDAIEDVTNAMGVLLAMEFGRRFDGREEDFMKEEIERMIRLAHAEREHVFQSDYYYRDNIGFSLIDYAGLGDFSELLAYREQLKWILQNDTEVQKGMVTGCGGAVNFLQGSNPFVSLSAYNQSNPSGFDIMTSTVGHSHELTSSVSSSGGEEKVDMHCGLCCGSTVVRKDGYYICKNPSCNGKIECSKVDKATV